MTSNVTYIGDLRTQSVHLASGAEMITDAPVDNHGKGEAFSPTDTVANALGTCMLTVMGIKAEQNGWNMNGTVASVTKIMQSEPRRIAEIIVEVQMNGSFDEKQRLILERTGLNCPVLLSLHPEVKKTIHFYWT
jgi:putative redox protein